MISSVPSSKRSGETVEADLIQEIPALEAVAERDGWHDARAAAVIEPTPALPLASTPLVDAGTPVEIKAAQGRLTSGERGRWYLRRGQHDKLRAAGGAYALVVYAPRPGHPHLARLLVPASIVDAFVSSWIDPDGRQEYAQIAWSRLIDPVAVSDGRDQR